ncbi:multimeric flavodoxin WrbA [Streptomyces phaeochromogenes]|nr:multimeric flavodoxin WrbA [Streptomyces phaeochromogenes]
MIATPIWLGHPSSICQRVLERLNAESSQTDEQGRPLLYDKVAAVAVVGNEDGAHKVSADVFQALNDVGFSLAPAPSRTGSGRPSRAPTTRTSTGHPRSWRTRPTRSPSTPSTSRSS